MFNMFKRFNNYITVAVVYAYSVMDGNENDKEYHAYILMENKNGKRKIRIESSWKYFAKRHGRYINIVIPWLYGANIAGIPKYEDVIKDKKPTKYI